ncbi:MAG: HD domain-containing protein, partial [Planctomycetota bacterium]
MNESKLASLLNVQIGYLAKSSGELLWHHHLKVWQIVCEFCDHISTLSEDERETLELAALTHDMGKTAPEVQAMLRGERSGGVAHKLSRDQYTGLLREPTASTGLTDDDLHRCWEVLACHHYVSEEDVRDTSSHRVQALTSLLIDADRLGSMTTVSRQLVGDIKRDREDWFDLACAEFSRFESPTTDVALDVIEQQYAENGWKSLLSTSNGMVFISAPNTRLPGKEDVSAEISRQCVIKSLARKPYRISGFMGDFLSGMAAELPHRFLAAHRDNLLREFADGNRAPIQFLKLAYEIAKNSGWENDDMPKIMRWVRSANSPAGHKTVKDAYEEETGERPDSINNDFFRGLFTEVTIDECLPGVPVAEANQGKTLTELSPETLYEALEQLAEPRPEQEQGRLETGIQDSIKACLCMAEESDFRTFARKQFERYCSYKTKGKATSGICERCASPITLKPADTDRLADALDRSTQIKAKKAPRALCPFCIYDNLIARGDNRTRVLLRIDTPVLGGSQAYDGLQYFIHVLSSGLRRPRDLQSGERIGTVSGLPVPPHLFVPMPPDEDKEVPEDSLTVPRGDRGVILELEKTRSDPTPGDLRARYEPLYHLLRLMGWEVGIGLEEQAGLFGKTPTTDAAAYNRSLAVIFIANSTGKRSNRYLFAKNLLEQSPAVAIAQALGEEG